MKTYLVKVEEKIETYWKVRAKNKEDAENNFYYGDEKRKTFVTQEVTEVQKVN